MTDADALLAAIRQAPDDDAPRLIYAEWLDEHGQPERAEFIRVQIELARQYPPELQRREAELLKKHHGAFAGPLTTPGLRFGFRRGFITSFAHTGLFVVDYDHARSIARTLRFFLDGSLIDGLLGKPVEPLPFETTLEQLTEHLRTKYKGPILHSFQIDGVDWEYSPRMPGTYELEAVTYPADVRIKFQLDDTEAYLSGSFQGSSLVLEFEGPSGVRHLQQTYKHVHIDGFNSFSDSP